MASAQTLPSPHRKRARGADALGHGLPKRRCRPASALDAALRHGDAAGAALYPRRRAALGAVPDAVFSRLLAGLGGDAAALRRIADANLAAPAVASLLSGGVDLAALNVRVHAFSPARPERVLAAYAGFYAGEPWARDVAAFVAREVFAGAPTLAIQVLSGGGVRDVLLADLCRRYDMAAGCAPPPHLILVSSPDVARPPFLIPYVPGAQFQR